MSGPDVVVRRASEEGGGHPALSAFEVGSAKIQAELGGGVLEIIVIYGNL